MSVNSISRKAFLNSASRSLLGLLFMACALHTQAATKKHKAKKTGVVHSMTVIMVAPPNNDEPFIGVIFRVSQRQYKLPKNANPEYLMLLRESEKNHTPVLVERAKEESDVIVSVKRDLSPPKN